MLVFLQLITIYPNTVVNSSVQYAVLLKSPSTSSHMKHLTIIGAICKLEILPASSYSSDSFGQLTLIVKVTRMKLTASVNFCVLIRTV